MGSTNQTESINYERLKGYLLDQRWHANCEIILDYMPPFPKEDTRPTVKICYNNGKEYKPFLRYSHGPRQGFFWDIYGDDFQNEQLAIIALSQAPAPRDVSPLTFHLPLPALNSEQK